MGQVQFLSLPDQIVSRLTEDILKGVYEPGQRLKEQELALKMGTSRAPLREAFRVLERDGLIEILPWRGVRIIEPTYDEIKELFEARADMFGLCARHVAAHGDAVLLSKIEADIDALIRSTDAGCDEREYKEMTNDISSQMYALIQNRYTRAFIDNLRQKMLWHYCHMGISSHVNRQDSNRYWHDLGQALLRRDSQAAETAAHCIIVVSKDYALGLLEEKRGGAAPAGKERPGAM
ncbi:FCD domain protein [Bordetella bronchiseptica GA96-01]|uniref:GntR family transcriptional regulator n=1 Tax=Bordetella bronchiseptica TaxID=518 RepID=UPI00045B27F4|nr:GntR family transcriptional regulator [Bordetella bronchiseptica]AZW32507.1 GntR family transcriptional regulator [Bordetella bronchiseptica]KCV43525.1 FCD domain protein [Bordetella bronchiseptica 345]KDC34254.1 FCD domain protein [Bordetella bronchiseptica GA96-01]